MVFNTGTDSSNFVSHTVDQQLIHPTLDLLIAHLASPIAGRKAITLSNSACQTARDFTAVAWPMVMA